MLRRVCYYLNCRVYLVELAYRELLKIVAHSIAERKKSMSHLDQDPNPPVEGSEYRDHTRVKRTGLTNRVKAVVKSDAFVNIRVLYRMWAERKKHK